MRKGRSRGDKAAAAAGPPPPPRREPGRAVAASAAERRATLLGGGGGRKEPEDARAAGPLEREMITESTPLRCRKLSNPDIFSSAGKTKLHRQLSQDDCKLRRGSLASSLSGKQLLPLSNSVHSGVGQTIWQPPGDTSNLVRMRNQSLGQSAPSLTAGLKELSLPRRGSFKCEVIDPNFDLHPISGSGLIIFSRYAVLFFWCCSMYTEIGFCIVGFSRTVGFSFEMVLMCTCTWSAPETFQT